MNLRAIINRALAMLGVPGLIGIGLILFAAGLYDSSIHDSKQRITEIKGKLTRVKAASSDNSAGSSINGPLDDFYRFFPASATLPQWLEKIYALAEAQGLDTPQGEYRMNEGPQDRMISYQAVLPMRGTYPQLRRFMAAVLNELPFVSLDDLRFERQRSEDAAVDAQIRLTIYLRSQ